MLPPLLVDAAAVTRRAVTQRAVTQRLLGYLMQVLIVLRIELR